MQLNIKPAGLERSQTTKSLLVACLPFTAIVATGMLVLTGQSCDRPADSHGVEASDCRLPQKFGFRVTYGRSGHRSRYIHQGPKLKK
jgi:hypothetical protein